MKTTNFCPIPSTAFAPTSTALTAVTDNLYYNIDNKHISILTLCDLSKAFDSVHHTTLLTKLSKNKIDTFWFEDYLFNRTQTVRLHNHLSSQLHLEYDVLQGSILGPVLFTVYVNDMQEHFNDCTLIQYADDTQFLHSASLQDLHTLVKNVETTLSRAVSYFSKNGLMLNSQKTQCMYIGSRQSPSKIPDNVTILLCGSKIEPSNNVKSLDLYIRRPISSV